MLESLFNKVADLGLQLHWKETATQAFSCEICEIFRNTYFEEHLRTTASVIYNLPKMTSLSWVQLNPSKTPVIQDMTSLPETLFLLVVDSLASSREKYVLRLLIFAFTSATKSKSNNILKKWGWKWKAWARTRAKGKKSKNQQTFMTSR